MDVLVTGGAGFIGSNLTERLIEEGHAVRVVDDFATGKRSNLAGLSAEVVEGSITDSEFVAGAVDGAEVVFHLAALPSVARSLQHPVETNAVNVGGTVTLLAAAHSAGVRRFVYAASSSAYGDTPELPKREDMIPRPKSPYAAAKLAGEYYCRAFADSLGLSTVSLRYFNVFGPKQDPTGGYAAVVPAFVSSLLDGEPPVVDGDGGQTRDFTYIDNVVAANLLAAEATGLAGEVINIATASRTSIRDLYDDIGTAVGSKLQPRHGPPRQGDVRDSLADISRAADLLGYRPLVDRQAGIERTVAWHRSERASRGGGITSQTSTS